MYQVPVEGRYTGQAEVGPRRSVRRTLPDVPAAAAIDHRVGFAVAVIITHQRLVTGHSPRHYAHTLRALEHVPDAVAGTPNRDVGLTVAIEISRNRNIFRQPKLVCAENRVAAVERIPGTVARAPESDIGFTVAVIIAGGQLVAIQIERSGCVHVGRTVFDLPDTRARGKFRKVRLTVAVKIRDAVFNRNIDDIKPGRQVANDHLVFAQERVDRPKAVHAADLA